MKKLSSLVAAALWLATAASSSLSAQKGVEIGVAATAGTPWILNSDDFAEDQDLNFRPTLGYNAGLHLGFNLTDGFGVSTGIIYSKQGQNYITNYDNVAKADQNTFSRELTYIRVPLLFKVNGSLDAGASSFFRIGPHLDFIQGAKYTYNTNTGFFQGTREVDMLNYRGVFGTSSTPEKIYSKMVVGLTVEAGAQVNLTKAIKLIIALHLEGSLTNTEDEDARWVYPSENGTLLNPERGKAWNVMAGLTLGLNYVLSFE